MVRFSRDVAFKNSKTSSALEILTVKHVHISVTCCHFLPSLLDDVFTCEELESIKKAKNWGVFYRCEEYA